METEEGLYDQALCGRIGGGADSTALALLLWERGEDFEMVFADTGAELPEVYWLLPRLAERVGKPLTVVSGGSFFQQLVGNGFMLPGPRLRWCTRILKQEPQDRFFAAIGAAQVAVGIRADEPGRLERPDRGGCEFDYPLSEAGMDKAAVKALCARYDLLNPVYEWRTNVSCFCCFFQRKRDWLGLLKNHPTLYALAEEWERQSNLTSKQGWGFSDKWSLERLRKINEYGLHNQGQLFDEQPWDDEEPCMICRM